MTVATLTRTPMPQTFVRGTRLAVRGTVLTAPGSGRRPTLDDMLVVVADELRLMGADIAVDGRRATIRGVEALTGASVAGHDVRAAAALGVAAPAARGPPGIPRPQHPEPAPDSTTGKPPAEQPPPGGGQLLCLGRAPGPCPTRPLPCCPLGYLCAPRGLLGYRKIFLRLLARGGYALTRLGA